MTSHTGTENTEIERGETGHRETGHGETGHGETGHGETADGGAQSPEIEGAVRPADPDVTILSSGHDVADARLHRHCAAFHRAGLRVEVIARGRPQDAPAGARFRPIPARGIAGRGMQALLLPGKADGRVLITLDPDLIPAARLRRTLSPGRRLAVDLHEDYVALLDDRAWATGARGVVARAWARTAVSLSRGADLTVVADQHVPPGRAVRRLVVRNLPDLTLLPERCEPDERPRALYVGDVRTSRGLFTMLRAIELAPDWELDIVGPVAPRDRARLDAWTAESDAAARVRLHGRMPPAAAWRLASGAWAGMSLLSSTPAFESAIPSKIYEYLACGLPVLTSPIRRAAELVEQSRAGAVVADAEQAAAALRGWSGGGRAEFELLRRAARDWAARDLFADNPYDRFADAVAELVAQVRGTRTPVAVAARTP
ncbi:glycosyltransferase [Actinocrinis puniceicyclus]|uniref:Glycosyltransferase n=1 Tax=Actinocrinis puniceicyclus TaxID=977794 RepID=A0A8J8BFC7_9ACTN|nr:glycosyltransferase [Actinocrinis puniceicyclus]MBS2966051.1 glycosyltransferase [Actinocrinis puniceicyclus]